ncbi:head-tail adaptor protein [Ensifer sp. ENS09]|uniref:head-tail adaptor protein n=1 Tax=Ensifer sp. ENS09 TaxID=2769263 RepID=UPI00177BF6B3|nr:head-tail adaptor protein [Ensifer sp. ENS09]MBD9652001.1 head-tail adaptor protein [Ensifer sp. ENS09]
MVKRSAGDLYHRYAFDKREQIDDGAGNTVGRWIEQFSVRAGVINLRGGEAVMAGRLEGKHTQVVFVRASSQTRSISTDWRLRDVRTGAFVNGKWTGVSYNIREITRSDDRQWIEVLSESGVADG